MQCKEVRVVHPSPTSVSAILRQRLKSAVTFLVFVLYDVSTYVHALQNHLRRGERILLRKRTKNTIFEI